MGGRGLIRLKYVHAFRDRMGRMRYYFRRHGKRNALPGLPGSSEFMAAYAAQLNNSSSQAEHRVAAAPGVVRTTAARTRTTKARTRARRASPTGLPTAGRVLRPSVSRMCFFMIVLSSR